MVRSCDRVATRRRAGTQRQQVAAMGCTKHTIFEQIEEWGTNLVAQRRFTELEIREPLELHSFECIRAVA
jgi:hypothetical protein